LVQGVLVRFHPLFDQHKHIECLVGLLLAVLHAQFFSLGLRLRTIFHAVNQALAEK
jgi:hypothetical protein